MVLTIVCQYIEGLRVFMYIGVLFWGFFERFCGHSLYTYIYTHTHIHLYINTHTLHLYIYARRWRYLTTIYSTHVLLKLPVRYLGVAKCWNFQDFMEFLSYLSYVIICASKNIFSFWSNYHYNLFLKNFQQNIAI